MQDFRAFTVKGNGRLVRLLTDIHVSPAFDPSSSPPPTGIGVSALWDTGASKSVISAPLAKKLGLVAVGSAPVDHAGGNSTHATYLVSFGLPNGVGVSGLLVTESPTFPGFDVLVGMDVIAMGDFSITNVGGQTWMSFRVPSCEAIDYVKDAHQMMSRATGRNDPCYCGSGQKFKRCHGK